MFLYEVMRYFVRRDVLGKVARPFSLALVVVLLVVGFVHLDRLYTSVTFLLTAAFLGWRVAAHRLARSVLRGLCREPDPFLLVNGVLTGWLLPSPSCGTTTRRTSASGSTPCRWTTACTCC